MKLNAERKQEFIFLLLKSEYMRKFEITVVLSPLHIISMIIFILISSCEISTSSSVRSKKELDISMR